MPAPLRHLTLQGAKDLVFQTAQSRGAGHGVGLEVELMPSAPHDDVVSTLSGVHWPGGSRLTFEPGGQVELSGPCLTDADAACAAMADDLAALHATGLPVEAIGMDPAGGRPRVLDAPRYRAMEAYFNQSGRTMMCDTAALQVNVDNGDDRRWRLVHSLAPVLAAAFANSPMMGGRLNGWKSNRLRMWLDIDGTRAAPVGGTSIGSWVDYAMAGRVMFVRASESRFEPVDDGMTMADWITDGHRLGYPTADDVSYHLTTLFPPVRPRGWLELRFFDSLPSPWWQVAAIATCRLLDNPSAMEACRGADALWIEAARDGVAHPALGAAALALLRTVPEAAEFVDRFTARGRCPADDVAVAAWA
jgi:glutamate--cysteine ligase